MDFATKALATEDGQSAQTTQLQAISAAIGNIGLNNIGNLATLTTTDKTSLVGAVNEVNASVATKADETEVAAIENVYGSKNILPNNAVTQTINGVTFTVNADKSVTAVGTATAHAQFTLNTAVGLEPGTYKLSGALSQNKRIFLYNGSTWINDLGNGVEFTITGNETQQQVAIAVVSGETVNGTFYPMIRDARIEDATYVPYAMTNRELTEELIAENIKATSVTGTISLYKAGNFKILKINDVRFPSPYLPAGESQTIGTIPSGYRPATQFIFSTFQTISGHYIASPIVLNTDGTISFTNLGSAQTAGYIKTCIVYI